MSTHTNPDEEVLRDLLDTSMSDVSAPFGIEARARAGGRRLRRRRQAGMTGLGVAAALAVAVPFAVTAGGGAGDDTRIATDDSPSVASSGNASPEPTGPVDQWWTMPASDMVETLRALLPTGVTLSHAETTNTDPAPGEEEAEMEGYLVARLTGPDGPGKVNVMLTPPDEGQAGSSSGDDPVVSSPRGAERYSCDPMWVADPASCTVLRNSAGTPIGQVVDVTVGGVRDLAVTMATPDGGTVFVDVVNTLDDKWPDGAQPSAERLPLTLAQARRIAAAKPWTTHQP